MFLHPDRAGGKPKVGTLVDTNLQDRFFAVEPSRNLVMVGKVRSTLNIHFIGVCGKGMGAIAAAMARAGCRVTGSDESCYPPMSDYLSAAGLVVSAPYQPQNLPAGADCFVVGKRVEEDNPELQAALADGRPVLSFPQFLRRHVIGQSRNLVVAGGIGKTTTTSMLAWILDRAGLEPDYLIGGLPLNFGHPARLNGSSVAVLEGDEYASCFNDRLAKFMHYRPEVLLITNVLEDHPDLYENLGQLQQMFSGLIRELPEHGLLLLPADDPSTPKLAADAPCRTLKVGFNRNADVMLESLEMLPSASRFRIDGVEVNLPMCGRMNVMNAAMAMLAAGHMGTDGALAARALAEFAGVDNRQAASVCGSVTVVHDKASHPHALTMLLESLRQRFPERRLVSLIQPRATGGQEWIYQRQMPDALARADLVLLLTPYEHKPKPGLEWPGGVFSIDRLVAEMRAKSVEVRHVGVVGNLAAVLATQLEPDDVMLVTLPEQVRQLRGLIESILSDLATGSRTGTEP